MKLSNEQEKAASQIKDWFSRETHHKQVFSLFGYAGTGKTTIAKDIAAMFGDDVQFAAFTGKAAEVMRTKGCHNATTLHSLMYIPSQKDQTRLIELQKALQIAEAQGQDTSQLKYLIKMEHDETKSPHFNLNHESDLKRKKLLIVDECSMIDRKLGEDLLTFGVPILLLGDPFQLPPVKGSGFFTSNDGTGYGDGRPDFMLEEVHRQALDSPVLQLATMVRNFKRNNDSLVAGEYGDSRVLNEFPSREEILAADQHLVGKNKTRTLYNKRIRELMGRESWVPETGDKVVCLRNNHELGLLNGSQWLVEKMVLNYEEYCDLEIRRIDDPNVETFVSCHAHFFQGEVLHMNYGEEALAESFDYAYYMTVHKAQGSQWDNVFVYDQSYICPDRRKWLYTAITRAAEKVTIIRHPRL